MKPDKSLENKDRRESLKKMGVATIFVVPTLMTFKIAECQVQASAIITPKFTMPKDYVCPPVD